GEFRPPLPVPPPPGGAPARLPPAPARLEPAELDTLLGRARDMAVAVAAAPPGRTAGELGVVFETAHAIVTSAAAGVGCGQGDQALIVPRLVDSVLRPLADAVAKGPGGPGGS